MAYKQGIWKRCSIPISPSCVGLLASSSTSDDILQTGFDGFVRSNPLSDKFDVQEFHHVELYCGDATNTYKRFSRGLGMKLIAKSDLSTGNVDYSTYCLASGGMKMLFTATSAPRRGSTTDDSGNGMPEHLSAMARGTVSTNQGDDDGNNECVHPFPNFDGVKCQNFFEEHGLGVRAIAIEVGDVSAAYKAMVNNGATAFLAPMTVSDKVQGGYIDIAEVSLYGDVVLRLVNTAAFSGTFLPNFVNVTSASDNETFGIDRLDHIVGNVWELEPVQSSIMAMTGFHTFAEFVAEDVGTVDSGLNSVVLASNNEKVLLPINEPTFGTRKKSQIQTFLEYNKGAGVQHMALFTSDIFKTMRKMRAASQDGGFEFLATQPTSYYKNLPKRIGDDALTLDQLRQAEELGLLVDRDDQGILLQIFSRPVSDRPTLFLEIIQRVGCDAPGCGGFGKGNFKDLFKSIQDYEDTLQR